MKRGKLIILYGINNLGKSTQAHIMVKMLKERGIKASYLKYPLYDLQPSGKIVNDFLRKGNPYSLSRREFQFIMIMNRTQYDAELRDRLRTGEWVIAEDYVGTGLAWGMGSGIDKALLIELNSHLVREDMGILFQGQRFMKAQEKDHNHETDHELTERVRAAHEVLADDYRWPRVNANGTIEEVTHAVWSIIEKKFL